MPELARRSINPNLANEIERVIDALASQSLSRAEFLKKLDRFCLAIEHAAATIAEFLNVAKAYFRPEREGASSLQNELHAVMADGVSSIQTKVIQ